MPRRRRPRMPVPAGESVYGIRGVVQLYQGEEEMKEIQVSAEDEGKILSAHIGDTLCIQLPDNPTTGYTWQLESTDERLLQLESTSYSVTSPGKMGSGGTRTFVFLAVSPGTAEIRFIRRRSWEPVEKALRRYAVTVQIHER
jgi:inhibitor of cysteine peptidase